MEKVDEISNFQTFQSGSGLAGFCSPDLQILQIFQIRLVQRPPVCVCGKMGLLR